MSLSDNMDKDRYEMWEQICYALMNNDKAGHSTFSNLFWDKKDGGEPQPAWSPTDYSSRVDAFLDIIGKVMGE
jgi:hypothetical protein